MLVCSYGTRELEYVNEPQGLVGFQLPRRVLVWKKQNGELNLNCGHQKPDLGEPAELEESVLAGWELQVARVMGGVGGLR